MATGSRPTGLAVGSKAPAFELPRDDGGNVSLADFAGRKLVLYFYPKADTPRCTREAIDFSGLRTQFHNAGADILGISADPVLSQAKFKAKHGLAIDLLSDRTHTMLEAYRVWGKNPCTARASWGLPGPPS
jgi:thioredoxin-dependent peroxiredoxin